MSFVDHCSGVATQKSKDRGGGPAVPKQVATEEVVA
jgi:hypothetical protein